MDFYHVIAKSDSDGEFRCLFTDLSVEDLRQRFLKPYQRGKSFFSGNELFSPMNLRSIQVVRTARDNQTERDAINKADRAHIDEINNSSPHVVIISPGRGYQPQDIAEAGEDVTHTFIKGPPGHSSTPTPSLKLLGWLAGIIATVLAAGLAKWIGWV